MDITDELIIAYVDGELDIELAKRLSIEIARDGVLRTRMEDQVRLKARIQSTYGALIHEVVPPRFGALLYDSYRPQPRRRYAGGMRRDIGWFAMAAAALLGVGVWSSRTHADLVAHSELGYVAAGALANALEHQSGEPAAGRHGSFRVVASFQDKDGRYCRLFEGSRKGSGVACRTDARWQIIGLTSDKASPSAESYRRASSGMSPALLAVVQDLGASEPLTPEQEKAVLSASWKGGLPLGPALHPK